MNDFKPQLEMHEEILNKYKKLLFENKDKNTKQDTKIISVPVNQNLTRNEGNFGLNCIEERNNSLSQIDILKSKYLNKAPSHQNLNTINNNLNNIHYRNNSLNDSNINHQVNVQQPNINYLNNNYINTQFSDNSNILDSLKNKYLNRNNIVTNARFDEMNTDYGFSQKRKSASETLMLKYTHNQKVDEIKPKSESVLDSFLQKYSDENLNQVLEKRLSDKRLLTSIKESTQIEGMNLNTNVVLNNNLLDSSSLEVYKILSNQSNIQYNISNQSSLNNLNLKSSFDDQQLNLDVNSSIDFSNLEKSHHTSVNNNINTHIETVDDIVANSNKIIQNFEKNRDEIFENLNYIVEKTTENLLRAEKKKDEINEIQRIEDEFLPLSKKLENLKNLKLNIDEDLKKNFIRGQTNLTEKPNSDENYVEEDLSIKRHKVELIKIPKSGKFKKEISPIKNTNHTVNYGNINDLINRLVVETTQQIFDKNPIKIMKLMQIDDSDSLEINKEISLKDYSENNKSNSSNKSSIITTRSKAMPKKNLCTFDNYMRENK